MITKIKRWKVAITNPYENKDSRKRKCCRLVNKLVPITEWLPNYKWKENFLFDFVSGFTLACINIPQGLAFSILANTDPMLGLITACFSTFIYCIFGTAELSSFGPVAVASILTGEAVTENEDKGFTNNQLATMITFTIGIYYLVAYFIQFGCISVLFVKPFRSAFVLGCTIHIFLKSIKMLFGLRYRNESGWYNLFLNLHKLYSNINDVNIPTLIISIVVLIILTANLLIAKPILERRTKIVLPVEAAVMVIASLCSYLFKFKELSVPVIGYVPTGLPVFILPSYDAFQLIWMSSLVIAVVNYSTTTSMTLAFNKGKLRTNQDLLAMGLANIISCNFQSITIGNSMMRTAIAITIGIKTLMASIVSAVFLFFVILFAGPLFSPMPSCILGCIIIIGAVLLIYERLKEFPSILKSGWENSAIYCASLLAVLCIDLQVGLIVGIVLSLRQNLSKQIVKEKQLKQQIVEPEIQQELIKKHSSSNDYP